MVVSFFLHHPLNATMNLLLSSNEIRKNVMNAICQCTLCKFLHKVINDPINPHVPEDIKTWAGRFKSYFKGQDQQDVELFLATTPRNFDRKSLETSLTTISTRF